MMLDTKNEQMWPLIVAEFERKPYSQGSHLILQRLQSHEGAAFLFLFFTEAHGADGCGEGHRQHDADGAGHAGDGLETHIGGA